MKSAIISEDQRPIQDRHSPMHSSESRQPEAIARIVNPTRQALLQPLAFGAPGRIVCQINQLVWVLVQVNHQPGLSLKDDIFPSILRNDPAPRAVNAVLVAGGNDTL
jgi:hypothetical protein